MTFSISTRMASLVLAFGFFFACSTSKPSVDSLIETNQYDLALAQIMEELSANSEQPNLLIQRGEINAILAKDAVPADRGEFYNTTRNSFDEAISAGADSTGLIKIHTLTDKYWSSEHNAGTAAYESSDDADQLEAITYFDNAIILKPTEVSSYLSKATAQYDSDDIDGAIATLDQAKNVVDPVPVELYENLGFLYLQNGEPDQSVFYYELANKDIVNSKNIAFGLVNAYISDSDNESAIDLLSSLADNYPNDASIKNVYGTQLYLITEMIMDDLVNAYSANDTALVSQIRFEAEGVGEQAEEQLVAAFQRDTTNTDYIESLAVFYNNLTGKYLAVIEVAFDTDKKALSQKAATLLDFAIEYYGRLAEISPQDSAIQSTLKSLNTLKENRFSS